MNNDTVNITCKHCGVKVNIYKDDQEMMGNFCNVNCAQSDYEERCFEQELNSEEPNFDGLWDAGSRLMLG